MGEKSFVSEVRRLLRQYWREITIVALIIAVIASIVAFLRGRGRKKEEGN